MCDDITEAENETLVDHPLGRRAVVRLGLGVAAAVALPGCSSDGAVNPASSPEGGATSASATGPAAGPGVRSSASAATTAPAARNTASRYVSITTPDGKADAFFVTPSEGKHAAVIMWPDIAGLRQAYETMSTRLAEQGYAVLVVNQYYRSAVAPVLNSLAEWRTEEGKAKLKPMIEALSADVTMRDASAFVAWLDTQTEVDTKRKIGSAGYCMGGPFTVRTAAAAPTRVSAAASFHGGSLATDKSDSPHLLIAKTQASYLFAIAKNDDDRDAEAKNKLRASADAAKRAVEIEVYPAQHGWCTIDSPVYDKEQGDRAWARMLELFRIAL